MYFVTQVMTGVTITLSFKIGLLYYYMSHGSTAGMTVQTNWPWAGICGRTEPAAEEDHIWYNCQSSPGPGCEVGRRVYLHLESSHKHCSKERIQIGKGISLSPSPAKEQGSTALPQLDTKGNNTHNTHYPIRPVGNILACCDLNMTVLLESLLWLTA